MATPPAVYKIDYSALTAAQIAAHIETMKSIGKKPSGDAVRALKEARQREATAS